MNAKPIFDRIWRWKRSAAHPIDRQGQRCRVVASGKLNSVCVEFEDGFRVVTSWYAVRRISHR